MFSASQVFFPLSIFRSSYLNACMWSWPTQNAGSTFIYCGWCFWHILSVCLLGFHKLFKANHINDKKIVSMTPVFMAFKTQIWIWGNKFITFVILQLFKCTFSSSFMEMYFSDFNISFKNIFLISIFCSNGDLFSEVLLSLHILHSVHFITYMA